MTNKILSPLIGVLAAVVGAAAIFYYLADPATDIMPRCVFNMLTGWKCPGCGSQRMIHALLHGDLTDAWHHNAFFILLIPLLLLLGFAEILRKRIPGFYRRLHSPNIIISLLGVTMLWWLLRNLFSF